CSASHASGSYMFNRYRDLSTGGAVSICVLPSHPARDLSGRATAGIGRVAIRVADIDVGDDAVVRREAEQGLRCGGAGRLAGAPFRGQPQPVGGEQQILGGAAAGSVVFAVALFIYAFASRLGDDDDHG